LGVLISMAELSDRPCFVCDKPIIGEGSKTINLGNHEIHFHCILVYTLRKAHINVSRNEEEKDD